VARFVGTRFTTTIMSDLSDVLRECGLDASTLRPLDRARWTIAVAGDRALDAWRALRAVNDRTGLWPIVTGPPRESRVPELEELSLLALAGHAPVRAPHAEVTAARFFAARGVPDRVPVAEDDDVEEPAADSESDEESARELLASLLGHEAPTSPFVILWDLDRQRPHEVVSVELVPSRVGWDVPARLEFGGWNDCPAPEEHEAVLRHWHERFGAELVGLAVDRLECTVARPPRKRGEARRLAAEQVAYCGDLLQGFASAEDLASTLPGLDVWSFWWD
jgi:hypothetical protein